MASARSALALFRRPLAAARPAPVVQVHRLSQCARLGQAAEVATASTAAPVDANASAVQSPVQPPVQSPVQSPVLPYFVQRTPSNNLPVYSLAKRGGNRKETKVRKIVGNVQALRRDLQKYLGLPEQEIVITQPSQHIVAKGQHVPKVLQFLQSKNF